MSFVAISRVRFPPELKEQIQAVGLEMLPIAKTQPGFISVAFHQSNEHSETMMYWEWESAADHERCTQSEDWQALMAERGGVFAGSGVEFSMETFTLLGKQ